MRGSPTLNYTNMKCKHCEVELTEDDFYTWDVEGNEVCESCEQEAWQYASSVVQVQHGEIQTFRHCSDFGFRDAEYWEEQSPDAVKTFAYQRTDAWRGYHYPVLEDGYITIADGWMTGSYDDVKWKHRFNEFLEGIQEGKIECPYQLTFAFALTSNVFSVATDVIIRESDLNGFKDWLINEGYSIEQLQDALS